MPVVPPVPGALPSQVFWDAGDVLDFARILINDAQGGLQGQELSADNPQTWPLLNLCYAKLCNALEDTNVEAVTYTEAIVGPLALAPTASFDPSTQVRLGYDGYWNGSPDDPTDGSVMLPGDCLQPLQLWERPSGSVQPFIPMKQVLGGLQSRWGYMGTVYGGSRFGVWEFRSNGGVPAIFMPGAGQANELRIRYIPSLALLEINPDGTYPQIPLARAGEALAYGVAAEWAEIRAAANAPSLRAKYTEQLETISNKSAKRENATITRARGYGFGMHPRRNRWW